MTRAPNPKRPALARNRLVWWVVAIALVFLMASCIDPAPSPYVSLPATPTGSEVTSAPRPRSRVPATPTGSAVKSVVDVPVGDIYIAGFGSSVAVDDISGDLFCFGLTRVAGELTETLYRVDPRTGARTVLATLPGSSPYQLDHLVATNGWVFWVESDVESLKASGLQRLVYLAIRADGTQRRVLASYEVPTRSAMGEPSPNSGFEAGGGTAMWLETRTGGRTVHLFDTRTAKTMLVKNQPKVRELGSVHGDRVLLLLETSVQLYSIRTGQFSDIDYMWDGMASGVMVAGWLPVSSQLTACFFGSSADPTTCGNPVNAQTTQSFFPRCVLGTYVAGHPTTTPDVVELINLAAPRDRTSISIREPGVTGAWSCGGKSLVQPWSVTQDQGGRRSYIRVITVG